MENLKCAALFTILVLLWPGISLEAQIRPPGYERQMRQLEERENNPLVTDSVTLIDTTSIFDPDTYVESFQIVRRRISIRDYCMYELGVNAPERLLDGKPITIIHPATFEEMKIRWNAAAGKIDTIR